MSKIINIRLPNTNAPPEYNPASFSQTLEAIQQVIRQLNTTYTPQATEDSQSRLDWFSGS
jgi:hypothetical protein